MLSAHDALLSSILVNYYNSENAATNNTHIRCVDHTGRGITQTNLQQEFGLVQQENNLILQRQCQKGRGIKKIASALLTGDYRLHLKLSIQDGSLKCSLVTVSTNPNASFLDRLLVDSSNHDCRNSRKKSAISSRLAIVTVSFDRKTVLDRSLGDYVEASKYKAKSSKLFTEYSVNTIDDKSCKTVSIVDIAKNGFIYLGNRYQFLLSKDPSEKTAFFLMDKEKRSDSMFPDASSLRNFVADFSSQPTISRAGEMV